MKSDHCLLDGLLSKADEVIIQLIAGIMQKMIKVDSMIFELIDVNINETFYSFAAPDKMIGSSNWYWQMGPQT